MDYSKFETFVHQKTLLYKVKRQPKEWEKSLADSVYDKGLISKIYAEHIPLERKEKKKS